MLLILKTSNNNKFLVNGVNVAVALEKLAKVMNSDNYQDEGTRFL
jgi:hypothetical protein